MEMKKTTERTLYSPSFSPHKGGPGGRAAGKARTGDIINGQSPAGMLPPEPALSFKEWSTRRMALGLYCTVEPSMTCLALKGDPICMSCHEGALRDMDKASETVSEAI